MKRYLFFHLITLVLAVTPSIVSAQNAAERRHDRVIQSIKEHASRITNHALTDIKSLDDWKKARPRIRKEFLYTMGLDPMPERTPLNVEVTGTVTQPRFRIEKIVFQSMPGLYVTGNLYIPRDQNDEGIKKRATILYVCGHSPHPKGAKWNYQDRAIWFAEHGFVCFVVDTLEFGEVPGIHHGLHNLNMWHWLSRGYTPAGVEVWNAIRAIDYLESRSEVDPKRIGITGISGGGAISWYAAAADERIAVAVPICGTIAFGSQAKHWRASGQCDCIYYHNTFLTDQCVVGALIAPRPLLICSGQRDLDFPPDGYHDAFNRIKRIHNFYAGTDEDSDRIKEIDESVGHTDSPLFRSETRQWMKRWLHDVDTPVKIVPNPTQRRFTPESLACLTRLPQDAINYGIDKTFIPIAKPMAPTTLGDWTEQRKRIMTELNDKTFRWFPHNRTPLKPKVNRHNGGWASRYASYKDVEIETEPGTLIRVQLLRVRQRDENTPLVIYAKRPGDSIYHADWDELLPVLGRCDIAIVNPRLTEKSIAAADYADIERSSAWIGRTIASMQVWDIMRTVDWLEEEKISPKRLSFYGKGDMAVIGMYAALLDERIDQVILRDPPTTHRISPALLNVLRITDIPEVAAALAPRELVFIADEIPPAFKSTISIYELHGEAEKIKSASSLPQALEAWKY